MFDHYTETVFLWTKVRLVHLTSHSHKSQILNQKSQLPGVLFPGVLFDMQTQVDSHTNK